LSNHFACLGRGRLLEGENRHLNIPKPGIQGFKAFGRVCRAQAKALLFLRENPR